MKKTIQAWKDEDFRLSLSAEERAQLPANPAGIVELTDEALDSLISGGMADAAASCCWSRNSACSSSGAGTVPVAQNNSEPRSAGPPMSPRSAPWHPCEA